MKALDNEDKYMPDTNFKGWMYTIMRNIFINNYRKVVRDQTFIDQTDNLIPSEPAARRKFGKHRKSVRSERDAPRSEQTSQRVQSSVCHARFRIQIP